MVSTEPDKKNRLRIAFIGRLTGPKGEIAKKLIATVFPHFPDIQFTIVGGPIADGLQARAGTNIEFTGWIADLAPLFTQFDLVIASGRTAIEALYAGVPVLAVGEARCVGFIVRENLSEVQRTNFGDCERAVAERAFAIGRIIPHARRASRPAPRTVAAHHCFSAPASPWPFLAAGFFFCVGVGIASH